MGPAFLAGSHFRLLQKVQEREPPGPLQWFLPEDSGLSGHLHPCPKAFWLQSKQLAGSSFSLGPHKHHFRPSCLYLGSSCLDLYTHACPSLCRAFSLPSRALFLSLSVSISISFPLLPSSPASLLLVIPPQPQNGSPRLPPSQAASPPSLVLTPAPLSLYSSHPLSASPASLLPRPASASPCLPIFNSVSSPSLLFPPLRLALLPARMPGFLSSLGVSVHLLLLSACLLPHRRVSGHPSFSAWGPHHHPHHCLCLFFTVSSSTHPLLFSFLPAPLNLPGPASPVMLGWSKH